MGDMIANAVRWLNDQRSKHASFTAIYSRGGIEIELPVTVGNTAFEFSSDESVTTQSKVIDFLVEAGLLLLDGIPMDPERGDRISFVIGGNLRAYEVLDFAGTGCYSESDPYGVVLRLHTKLVSVVPVKAL